MNPTWMAFQKAMMQVSINAMMGISHVTKKDRKLDQTDGKLFATKPSRDPDTGFPRSDLIEMAEAEEKERNTRAYLDSLAEEVKNRDKPQEETPEDVQLKRPLGDVIRDAQRRVEDFEHNEGLRLLKATGRAPRKPSQRKPREDGNFR